MAVKPRAYVVLGTGNCGTSCVAGVCHHLGLPMGTSFGSPTRNNPKGAWEDCDLVDLNDDLNERGRIVIPEVDEYIRRRTRHAKGSDWGMKDPRMVRNIELWHERLPDPWYIWVTRDFREVVQSWSAAHRITKQAAEMAANRWARRIERFSEEKKPVYIKIDYNRLLACPRTGVRMIAQFIGKRVAQEAIDWVDPSLKKALAGRHTGRP